MDTATIACFVLVAWLLLGEPLLGRWPHRRLLPTEATAPAREPAIQTSLRDQENP